MIQYKLFSSPYRFSLLWVLVLIDITTCIAQQIGTEQLVAKNIYKGDFTVAGDKDTYYPVVFKYGEQNMINHLKIYRSYYETGPNELSLTHKGGLLLEFDVNYGGWGGQSYGWKVANHQYFVRSESPSGTLDTRAMLLRTFHHNQRGNF